MEIIYTDTAGDTYPLDDVVAVYVTDMYDLSIANSETIEDTVDANPYSDYVATTLEFDGPTEDLPTPSNPSTPFEQQIAMKNKIRYDIDAIIEQLNTLTIDTFNRGRAIESLNSAYRYAETAIGQEYPLS